MLADKKIGLEDGEDHLRHQAHAWTMPCPQHGRCTVQGHLLEGEEGSVWNCRLSLHLSSANNLDSTIILRLLRLTMGGFSGAVFTWRLEIRLTKTLHG